MRSWVVALLFGAVSACGSSAVKMPVATAPLSTDERVIFENGIDLLEKPEALQDRWLEDWERELDARIKQSDLIAIGVVTNVRSDVDPGGRTSYRLLFSIDEKLSGQAQGSELHLSSEDGAPGYGSIAEHRQDMLERPLLVFVKYALSEGQTTAYFHLAFPSETAKKRISDRLEKPNEVHVYRGGT